MYIISCKYLFFVMLFVILLVGLANFQCLEMINVLWFRVCLWWL